MDYKTENHVFDSNGNIAGWDEIKSFKIETTNARSIPIELEITRGVDTPYWKLKLTNSDSVTDNAVTYEQYDATHARFKLKVKPRTKMTFGYVLTIYVGRRQENFSQKK